MSSEPEEELGRPFISAFPEVSTSRAGPDPRRTSVTRDADDSAEFSEDLVRPYLVTGGRVHDAVTGLETVFVRTDWGARQLPRYSFEHHDVLQLCESPQSVAEMSALLTIPLGVAAVVARDLESEGMLSKAQAPTDPTSDPTIIMRLIDVVSAL